MNKHKSYKDMLDADEKVLWEGKSQKPAPSKFGSVVYFTIAAILFLTAYYMHRIPGVKRLFDSLEGIYRIGIIVFVPLFLIALGYFVLFRTSNFFDRVFVENKGRQGKRVYMVTNKRVIVWQAKNRQKTMNLEDIRFTDVEINPRNRQIGNLSIVENFQEIDKAEIIDLYHISNPYSVQQIIEEAIQNLSIPSKQSPSG